MRTRIVACRYLLGIILPLLVFGGGLIRAGSNSIISIEFSGTIQNIDGNTVTLRCEKPNPSKVSIRIDETAFITLDGKRATLDELRIGHTARVVILNGRTTILEAKTR